VELTVKDERVLQKQSEILSQACYFCITLCQEGIYRKQRFEKSDILHAFRVVKNFDEFTLTGW